MRISKILAGLSAAAIAGSMLTLITSSADDSPTTTNDGIPVIDIKDDGTDPAEDTLDANLYLRNKSESGESAYQAVELTQDGKYSLSFQITDTTGDKIGDRYNRIALIIPCMYDEGKALYPAFNISISSIKSDDTEISFDAAKLRTGELDDDGSYVIELYDSNDADNALDINALKSGITVIFDVKEFPFSKSDTKPDGTTDGKTDDTAGGKTDDGKTDTKPSDTTGGKTDTKPSDGGKTDKPVDVANSDDVVPDDDYWWRDHFPRFEPYKDEVNPDHVNHSPLVPVSSPFTMDAYDADHDGNVCTSMDLYDYLKACQARNPDEDVIINFKLKANQTGVFVASFLQAYEPHTEDGEQVYWVDKDHSIIVGTKKVKTQDTNEDGTLKFETKDVEDYVYLEDGTKKIAGTDKDGNPIYATEKKKVPDTSKPVLVEKWQGTDGKFYNDDEVSEMYAWHNYYVTEAGLVDIQTLNQMAPGVTSVDRFSALTAAQIENLKKHDGMYFDDNMHNPSYGHFVVFGHGREKEYSFRLSKDAVAQILEKSEKSKGAPRPYTQLVGCEEKDTVLEHGPIWLQCCGCSTLTDVAVHSHTTIKTQDAIPVMYGKQSYAEMYNTSASSSGNSTTNIAGNGTGNAANTPGSVAATPGAASDATDKNAETGTGLGLGVVGMLLAGAAIICTKKKQ